MSPIHAGVVPTMPLDDWTRTAVDWLYSNLQGFFNALNGVLEAIVGGLQFALTAPPTLVMVALLTVLALALAGWRVALFTVVGLLLIVSLELWDQAMLTLALILIATTVSLVLGVPIGIAAAKLRVAETIARPVLDLMQTLPPFVYLVPFAILLGLGAAPALIATIIFAMPPAARLTMLGIKQVPAETVEASRAFGSTPAQTLFKVEIPLALSHIKTGINQVIMLSLSMVVVAALIGAGGLGKPVVFGLQQLDVGTSLVGGVGIVIIAIALDRVTRNVGSTSGRIPYRRIGALVTRRSARTTPQPALGERVPERR